MLIIEVHSQPDPEPSALCAFIIYTLSFLEQS